MVRMIPDNTGRFWKRPYYHSEELDVECEEIISRFLHKLHGRVGYPVSTDDLTKLIERDAEDLDMYADLAVFGSDVEGMTEFRPGGKPRVRISRRLSSDPRLENRLRTTLAHEYGHVHFHAPLWAERGDGADLFPEETGEWAPETGYCKHETLLDAPWSDWMEWQAGYVCGALLMPRKALAGVVDGYLTDRGIDGVVPVASAHGRWLVARVARGFEVSREAARVRLVKLDYLGAGNGMSLF